MGFRGSVRSLFLNGLDFRGRASRAEFWHAAAFAFASLAAASLADDATGTLAVLPATALLLLLPTLSVQVRRLHDIGRSGWWICAIPAAGALSLAAAAALGPSSGTWVALSWAAASAIVGLMLLAWFSDAGHPDGNRFGPSPYPREPQPIYLATLFG